MDGEKLEKDTLTDNDIDGIAGGGLGGATTDLICPKCGKKSVVWSPNYVPIDPGNAQGEYHCKSCGYKFKG